MEAGAPMSTGRGERDTGNRPSPGAAERAGAGWTGPGVGSGAPSGTEATGPAVGATGRGAARAVTSPCRSTGAEVRTGGVRSGRPAATSTAPTAGSGPDGSVWPRSTARSTAASVGAGPRTPVGGPASPASSDDDGPVPVPVRSGPGDRTTGARRGGVDPGAGVAAPPGGASDRAARPPGGVSDPAARPPGGVSDRAARPPRDVSDRVARPPGGVSDRVARPPRGVTAGVSATFGSGGIGARVIVTPREWGSGPGGSVATGAGTWVSVDGARSSLATSLPAGTPRATAVSGRRGGLARAIGGDVRSLAAANRRAELGGPDSDRAMVVAGGEGGGAGSVAGTCHPSSGPTRPASSPQDGSCDWTSTRRGDEGGSTGASGAAATGSVDGPGALPPGGGDEPASDDGASTDGGRRSDGPSGETSAPVGGGCAERCTVGAPGARFRAPRGVRGGWPGTSASMTGAGRARSAGVGGVGGPTPTEGSDGGAVEVPALARRSTVGAGGSCAVASRAEPVSGAGASSRCGLVAGREEGTVGGTATAWGGSGTPGAAAGGAAAAGPAKAGAAAAGPAKAGAAAAGPAEAGAAAAGPPASAGRRWARSTAGAAGTVPAGTLPAGTLPAGPPCPGGPSPPAPSSTGAPWLPPARRSTAATASTRSSPACSPTGLSDAGQPGRAGSGGEDRRAPARGPDDTVPGDGAMTWRASPWTIPAGAARPGP
jgi:hypothetical protein